MRIALTRLRAAILFFAPAIDASKVERIRREAGWLNSKLGAARDLDVSLQRQRPNDTHPKRIGNWKAERQRQYLQVQRTLRTKRYHQLVKALRAWTTEQDAGDIGTQGTASFSTARLGQWQAKLLQQARRLDRLGPRKRHKLRIRTKRLRYALEWSLKLTPPKEATARKAMIAYAKTIQDSLGKLNDANRHHALAKAQHLKPLPGMSKLGTPKKQKRLLAKATKAFRELGRHPLV